MPKERNKAVSASYLFLRKENEILILRRQGSGYYDNWYSVPAGHVEAGELPIGALIREVREEVGIVIAPEDIKFAHMMYRSKLDDTGERVDLFFEVKKWRGEITNVEPDKCSELRWISIDVLPENTIRFVKEAILNYKNGIPYSEIGITHPASIEAVRVNKAK